MNQQVIEGSAESKESLNSKAKLYTLESDPKNLLDISALMIHRLNAGYKLDSLKHNAQLAGRFMHSQSQSLLAFCASVDPDFPIYNLSWTISNPDSRMGAYGTFDRPLLREVRLCRDS